MINTTESFISPAVTSFTHTVHSPALVNILPYHMNNLMFFLQNDIIHITTLEEEMTNNYNLFIIPVLRQTLETTHLIC